MADSDTPIEKLSRLRGLGREFTDFRGRTRTLSAESKRQLLGALGHSVDDPLALDQEAQAFDERDWIRVLGPLVVLRRDARVPFTVLSPLLPLIRWRVHTEQGDLVEGTVDPATLDVLADRRIREFSYVRLGLELPTLPTGYHRLVLEKADGSPLGATLLVVAPAQCYEPAVIRAGHRLWGPAIQLYSLRSGRNWGIGDFTDLAGFAEAAAQLGADIVGLNPLHASFPANPAHAGPYSPSSRYFLNILYIDPENLPEYRDCLEAQRLVGMPEFQARLEALRAAPFVDYPGVTACKLEVLRLVHDAFAATATAERRAEFEQFVTISGHDLELFAIFNALHEQLAAAGHVGGWQSWPSGYRDPAGGAVRSFRELHARAVDFHCWLQWVATAQLRAAEHRATAAGMRLGMYRDLAVGPSDGGAETWAGGGVYVEGATVGAPPDALALQGQDWGIPPFDPDRLRESAYEPFVRLLRANMGHGGALRIDHVMMLMRLWWVPRGSVSAEGGYVAYPLEELLAILALESERCRCLIIGEDLGTVPGEIRAAMAEHRVYSYRVLLFERDDSGKFRLPGDYPRAALVTVSTHDLPPLASFWSGSDITLRERLGLYPEPVQAEEERRARVETRSALLDALGAAGYPATGKSGITLLDAVQRFLAASPATVLMLQPEDWLGMATPVNVPGTHAEYPNWGRKLSADWQEFMGRADVRRLAEAVNALRGQSQAIPGS
jgi:4-alpha-glucanotransferase